MNNSFIIRRTDIEVSGVSGHHTVMHISDSHLCVHDSLSPESEISHSEKRERDWSGMKRGFARAFGDPITEDNDVCTKEAFDRIMEYASELKPELLILSGDTLEYMHGAGERYLRKKLSEYGRPFICVPGNHENSTLEGVWSEKISVYRGDGFTFAGIDNRRKTVSDLTLSELSSLLSEGKPVFPVYHIPLASSYNRDAMKRFDSYYVLDEDTDDLSGRKFVHLIADSPCVRASFCGHVHGFGYSMLSDGKPQISCSSSMIGNIHLIDIHGEMHNGT